MTHNMRVSLPPGAVLKGKKHTYTVKNIICLSERTTTVLCSSEDGRLWRLKFYNGNTSVTKELQERMFSVEVSDAVLPVDLGEFSNLRFAVFPDLSITSTDKVPVSVQLIEKKIIPKMTNIIARYHKQGILLRDICPEHILYRNDTQEIAFCGFSNPTMLQGKATITKAPGFGQHCSFVAPEVEKYGYSKCSDYFSLGMTLLNLLYGKNPREHVDLAYLKQMPYELYGVEDKITYLALGLIIPDPRKRWGYNEIQCWLNNQHIPLMAKGAKNHYQFSKPFVIGNTKCWNEGELLKLLTTCKEAWNKRTVQGLTVFLKDTPLSCRDMLLAHCNNQMLSTGGKIFRCIYTLKPSMSGLWWNGVQYANMQSLVTVDINVVSQLLQDQNLSWFCRTRQSIEPALGKNVYEFEQLEQLERSAPGNGAHRCMMRFAKDSGGRTFTIEGRVFGSFSQLLNYYKQDGCRLKQISSGILKNTSFQAWLWASGMERIGTYARSISESQPERSFFLLLSMCESHSNDERTKQLARRLFMKCGEYAPIVWLVENISDYKITSAHHKGLYGVFANASFSTSDSLEVLTSKGQALVMDYQTFVSRTMSDLSQVRSGTDAVHGYGYYPVYSDCIFDQTWEDKLETCAAFYKWIGE